VSKVSVEGGAVVPLGDIRSVGVSWGQDGSIFVGQFAKGLLRIPDSGGPPETVLGVGVGEQALSAPQILPGGRAVLFVADPALDVDKVTIEVLTLADGKRKIVARGGQSPRYLATSDRTGHLVYVNRATLFAVPFDLDTLEARGTAVPVLDDVAYAGSVGTGHFDVSRTGTFVYRRAGGGADRLTTVQWVDPLGKRESLLAKPGLYANAILSPDGTRVALTVSERGTRYDVWVYDSQRDIMTRLTFDGFNSSPTWSPDGRYVLFSPISRGIFQARADGGSRPQALTPSTITQLPKSFMPDGKRLAYVDQGSGERNAQIWTVALEEQGNQWTVGTPEPFLKSSFADQAPSFSPDGRGWRITQTNRERMKCSSGRFLRRRPGTAASGRFRTAAARFRAGPVVHPSWCTRWASRSWPRGTP
jgi:dipeptidyl aminopeptidase/acylaminoacyl peptidase